MAFIRCSLNMTFTLATVIKRNYYIKDKPTKYNTTPEERHYSNVKLIKLYNDVLDERIQGSLNHHVQNRTDDSQISIVVFSYDGDKDQYGIILR